MKKTFTANISGTVFHIEEDAYDQLQRYLANIRAKFSGSTGSEEIMADIEARIAELFNERLQGRQVVTIADVDHVKAIMGQPEDFEGADEGAPTDADAQAFAGPRRKRLFRDPDDQWVAGVIGGIAAYFNFDPLWLRIAFGFFLVVGWGSPVLLYLVMWVLVPRAETPAEKLSMRGEPVTVDNIKRVFDEGAERVKAGAGRVAAEAQEMGDRWRRGGYGHQGGQRPGNGVERVLRSFFQVMGKVVGVFVLFLGALLAFGFITAAAGGVGMGWFDVAIADRGSMRGLFDAWAVSPGMMYWTWIGLAVFFLVPIVGLLLAGLRLLFDVRAPRWMGWALVPAWFASIALLTVVAMRQTLEFKERERLTETVDLPMPADRILRIAAAHDPYFGDSRQHYSDDLDMIHLDGDQVRWGYAMVDVKESPDSLFHLEMTRIAHGRTFKEASRRAQGIRYEHILQDSLLSFPPFFTTDLSDRLRGQNVHCIVRVPQGAAVRFDRGSGRIIYDVKNTTDTQDEDMIGRTWTMTPEGLKAGTPAEVGTEPERKDRVKVDVQESKEGKPTSVHIEIPTKEARLPSLIGLLRASVEL